MAFAAEVPSTDEGSSWFSKLGSIGKGLLDTGADIYKSKTAAKIESARLSRERIAAARETASRQSIMPTAGVPMAVSSGFPILPVVLGIGALGAVMFFVMRKK